MKMRASYAAILLSVLLFVCGCPKANGQTTTTPNLGLQVPAYQSTNWQVPIDWDLNRLDTIFGGTYTLPVGATPGIGISQNWVTANVSGTTITNLTGGYPGQIIRLVCGTADSYTTLATSANISVVSPWSCPSGISISLVLVGNVWTEIGRAGGGASGSGTVTLFSADASLSPLFTTSVSNATSTPHLSFSLSNAAQNSVFAGPPTGGLGAPSFQTAPTFSAANLTNFPTLNQNTTGNAATATALAAAPSLCSTGQAPTGIIANGNATGCSTLLAGPATSTTNDLAAYGDGTGKVINDSGIAKTNVGLLSANQTFAGLNTFTQGMDVNGEIVGLPPNPATSTNNYPQPAFGGFSYFWDGTTSQGEGFFSAGVTPGTGANPSANAGFFFQPLNTGHGTTGALSVSFGDDSSGVPANEQSWVWDIPNGGGFSAIFQHANTANRTYTFPDVSGNFGVWTGSWTPGDCQIAQNTVGLFEFTSCGGSIPLTDSYILVGNASNVATGVPMSGGCTMADTGAVTCNYAGNTGAAIASLVQTLTGCNTSGYSFTPQASDCIPSLTNPMTTLGDTIYGGSSGTVIRLAGPTTNGTYCKEEVVTASASVAPTWGTCSSGTPGGSSLSTQYNNAGSFGGIASPAGPGIFNYVYLPTSATPLAPVTQQLGVAPRALSGSASTDTVLYSDVYGVIIHDKAATGTVTETLPTPTTLNNAGFAFTYCNNSAQTDNITPTTWTISLNNGTAGSSISVASGVCVHVVTDPFNSTRWDAFSSNSGGGGGAVSSVFGRTGAVVATAGDYSVDKITYPAANATVDWSNSGAVNTSLTLGPSTSSVATINGLATIGCGSGASYSCHFISGGSAYSSFSYLNSSSNVGIASNNNADITYLAAQPLASNTTGVPGIIGSNDSTLQTASIASTTMFTTKSTSTSGLGAGMYELKGALICHTGQAATTVTVTLTAGNGVSATTYTLESAVSCATTGTEYDFSQAFYSGTSQAIAFSTTASGFTTGSYDLHLRLKTD